MIECAKGYTRKPAWIKDLRAGASGALINKGLQGRGAGDALNTRASGHPLKKLKYKDCLTVGAGSAREASLGGGCARGRAMLCRPTHETFLVAVALNGGALYVDFFLQARIHPILT